SSRTIKNWSMFGVPEITTKPIPNGACPNFNPAFRVSAGRRQPLCIGRCSEMAVLAHRSLPSELTMLSAPARPAHAQPLQGVCGHGRRSHDQMSGTFGGLVN